MLFFYFIIVNYKEKIYLVLSKFALYIILLPNFGAFKIILASFLIILLIGLILKFEYRFWFIKSFFLLSYFHLRFCSILDVYFSWLDDDRLDIEIEFVWIIDEDVLVRTRRYIGSIFKHLILMIKSESNAFPEIKRTPDIVLMLSIFEYCLFSFLSELTTLALQLFLCWLICRSLFLLNLILCKFIVFLRFLFLVPLDRIFNYLT